MPAFINNDQRANITAVAKEVATSLHAMLTFNTSTEKPQYFFATFQPSLYDEESPSGLMFDRLLREVVLYAEQNFKIKFDANAVKRVLQFQFGEGTKVSIGGDKPKGMYTVSFNWKDAYQELWNGVLKSDLRDLFLETVGEKKDGTQLERSLVFSMDKVIIEEAVLKDNIFGDGVIARLQRLLNDVMESILQDRKLGHIRRASIVVKKETVLYYVTVVEDERGNALKTA